MPNELLLLQTFTVNGSSFQGFGRMGFLQEMAQLIAQFGVWWFFFVAGVQLLGSIGIYQAVARAKRGGSPRELIFSPFVWQLVALVTGPLGLIGTALAVWWLGYAPYTKPNGESGESVSPSAGPSFGGDDEHQEKVARLQAELDELRSASSRE